MSEEQRPRVHPQDPAEGADAEQAETGDEPRVRPQDPAEGADDGAVAGEEA